MRACVPTIAALLSLACRADPSSPAVRPLPEPSAAVEASSPYTAIDMTPPGALGGFGLGINDDGATAMVVDFRTGRAGFLRKANGSFVNVGQLPGGTNSVWANDVNNANQVVGSSQGTGFVHAYVWSESNGMRDLGTLGGRVSWAEAINNRGQVVGTTDVRGETHARHAFLWSPRTGEMQDLGTLPGHHSSEATDINDRGEVVGSSDVTAFLWTSAGGMIDLGKGDGWGSIATGINQEGVVVGYLYFPFQATHAFRWTRAGGLVDLGTFGAATAGLEDVNDRGLMVGNADGRALVRSAAGRMTYLPDLGAGGTAVRSVNECGQAVGDVHQRPVLWTKHC